MAFLANTQDWMGVGLWRRRWPDACHEGNVCDYTGRRGPGIGAEHHLGTVAGCKRSRLGSQVRGMEAYRGGNWRVDRGVAGPVLVLFYERAWINRFVPDIFPVAAPSGRGFAAYQSVVLL